MRARRLFWILCIILVQTVFPASKGHEVFFGKWTQVKLFLGANDDKSIDIKVRPLMIDGKIREFTTGDPHDITDRTFVVRRAYRVNDQLPEDAGDKSHRWKWQTGKWISVDRATGKTNQLNLPDFDPFYSNTSWYRDYYAYCGLSDDLSKVFAVVGQSGRKKLILRKELGAATNGDTPDSECPAPTWQRQPTRVTFAPVGRQKFSFEVWDRSVDLASESETDQ